MSKVHVLAVWDYAVIATSLCVSVTIGLYFRFSGGRQKSTSEYLMAGQNMSRVPVIFSLVVTKLSSIAMLGEPSEIYLYGTQRVISVLSVNLGIMIAAYVFLPVFFSIGGFSVHRYLEDRFGKSTRTGVSFLWILQTILYMSAVLYTPALALSAVSDLDMRTSIVILGTVCTLYSCLGGLKAVLWTDMFQAFLMYGSLLAVLVQGILHVGGFGEVLRIADQGKRLQLFDVALDFRVRYTFWNSLSQGIIVGLAYYGVNQTQVQRLLSIKNLKNAQSALLWSMIPSTLMQLVTTSIGVIMYAVYSKCNPLSKYSDSGIQKGDQIVPYFIVSELALYPGVAGLCVSGIFAGCLSSISSAINSLSAVTMADIVRPLLKVNGGITDSKSALIAKLIGAAFGITIVGLAFLVNQFRSVLQASVVFNGTISGPVLGLFFLGMMTLRSNERGVLIGLAVGVLLSGWIGFSSSLSGVKYPYLPLSDDGCAAVSNATQHSELTSPLYLYNSSVEKNHDAFSEGFVMHRISYMWVSFIGLTVTVLTGYVTSAAFGYFRSKEKKISPKLISPVVRKILGCPQLQTTDTLDEMEVFV